VPRKYAVLPTVCELQSLWDILTESSIVREASLKRILDRERHWALHANINFVRFVYINLPSLYFASFLFLIEKIHKIFKKEEIFSRNRISCKLNPLSNFYLHMNCYTWNSSSKILIENNRCFSLFLNKILISLFLFLDRRFI